jgi:hypothetical protein
LALIIALTTASQVIATVDGPEVIKVLGYDEKAGAIYFLHQYLNESGELDDLIVYMIKDRVLRTEKPLSFKVFSRQSPDQIKQYQNSHKAYIADLTKRLAALNNISIQNLDIKYEKAIEGYCYPPTEPPSKIAYWKQRATVSENGRALSSVELESYHNDRIQTLGALETPDKSAKVIILRYIGQWPEIGYPKDSLLLIPEPEFITTNKLILK